MLRIGYLARQQTILRAPNSEPTCAVLICIVMLNGHVFSGLEVGTTNASFGGFKQSVFVWGVHSF
jgi:hypothetical protein